MPEILVVCPQERDRREIRAAGLDESYGVRFAGPDLDAVEFFDPPAFLEEAAAEPVDGVIGTKDRSALLAALIAERRGLASPSPQALLACQHKPTSRELQRAVAPEATPPFALVGEFAPRSRRSPRRAATGTATGRSASWRGCRSSPFTAFSSSSS